MNRSAERVRLLLGAAAVSGLLVVPVALAGSAPGAGGPRAAASAGVKKKLKSLQRQLDALKAKPDTPGPQGAQGSQGLQGVQGVRGPGAISYDRQFPVDAAFHDVATVNGIVIKVVCSNTPQVGIQIQNPSHAWGTWAQDGVLNHSHLIGGNITAVGTNTTDLDVVVKSGSPVDPGRWTRIDANGIRGSACNFHAMVTPSSSVG
jgi:hypothetical protein